MRSMTVWLIVAMLPLGGVHCISDDRCGADATQKNGRCIPIETDAALDAEPEETAPPKEAAADASDDAGGSCLFTPTAEQLAGTFKQTGTVAGSDCTTPLPVDGAAFDADVTFSLDNTEIKVSVVNDFVTLDGSASIGEDGRVTVSATGSTLGIELTATLTYCFDDADNANAEVAVAVETSTPLCKFDAPGTLERQ